MVKLVLLNTFQKLISHNETGKKSVDLNGRNELLELPLFNKNNLKYEIQKIVLIKNIV